MQRADLSDFVMVAISHCDESDFFGRAIVPQLSNV